MPSHEEAFKIEMAPEEKNVKKPNLVFKALFYKALHTQKRQKFTNICCIFLCPAMLVSICGVIQLLLNVSLGNASSYTNYNCVRSASLTGNDQLTSYGCTNYFMPFYPNETALNNRDLGASAFQPYAWKFDTSNYAISYQNIDINGTKIPSSGVNGQNGGPPSNRTSQYAYGNNVSIVLALAEETSTWGSRSNPLVSPTSSNISNSPVFPGANFGSGFLQSFPNYFRCDSLTCLASTFVSQITSASDYQKTIVSNILSEQAEQNKKNDYYQQTPMGMFPQYVVSVDKSDLAQNKISATIQMGDFAAAIRGSSYSSSTYSVFELGNLINMISNALYKQIAPKWFVNGGFRSMPYSKVIDGKFDFSGIILSFFIPLCFTFLLPIFVHTLVKEKEERIFILLKMNGVDSVRYFVALFVQYFLLYIISMVIFLVVGAIWGLKFILKTNFALLLILLLLWGLSQVSLAFLLGSLFNKAKNATIFTAMLTLGNIVLGLMSNSTVALNMPTWVMIYSPYAFFRSIILMVEASTSSSKRPYGFVEAAPPNEVGIGLIALSATFVAYFILAMYVLLVRKSEFGTRKSWYFPITWLVSKMESNSTKKNGKTYKKHQDTDLEQQSLVEDQDVKDMKIAVDAQNCPDSALVVHHLRKTFGLKVAVKDATFYVEKNTVFGLLGSNGAGKSTLISMLSGLLEPSFGSATYKSPDGDFDLLTDIDNIHQMIGICAQHDIFVPDLSVEEHLVMFALLKGVNMEQAKLTAQESLEFAKLGGFEHRFPNKLSGGEKRRVSISMANVGNPALIFLDEPTVI